MERVYCHIIPPIWTTRQPDMAAAWLTRFVRHHGWEVCLLDLNVELFRREARPGVRYCWEQLYGAMDPEEFSRALLEDHGEHIRGRLEEALGRGCQVFGMLHTTVNTKMVAALSLLIKELAPGAHVVVGGPGATSYHRYRRRYRGDPPMVHPVERELEGGHAVDSWALGEGEHTLLELLERRARGEPLRGIPGLVLTADGPGAPLRERALIREMDSLPPVDFEGFELGRYSYRALPFQLSRGCAVARCSHCGLKGYARGFRVRSPEHALAEIEGNIARYGIRELHFADLGVNGDLERLERFCDEVIRRELGISWQSFIYIRPDMTPGLMRKVVESGCRALNYGFESGSDTVLRSMRKLYTADDAARVLRMTREAGGRSIVNLMVGHPGEGERELQETLEFLSRNAEHIDMVASVSVTEVQVHSPLLDERERFGVELLDRHGRWRSVDGTIDWRERNERAHRVTEHLRTLGIPCFETFWEPPHQGHEDPPGELRSGMVRITALEVTAPELSAEGQCRIDLPVLVHVGYRADPTVRWAVFDLEVTDLAGQPVFATPPTSARFRTVELEREGFVRLAFGPQDLPPGELVFTAAVHPLGGAVVYDRHIERRTVRVMGVPANKPPTVTPVTWTRHPGRLDPRTLPVEQLRLLQAGHAEPVLRAADPVDVEVHLRRPDAAIHLRLRAPDGSVLQLPLDGQGLRRVGRLDPLTTEGTWELELDAAQGEELATSRHRVVVGRPTPGLALLEPRARWFAPDEPVAPGAPPSAGLAPGARLSLALGATGLPTDRNVRLRGEVSVHDRQGRLVASASTSTSLAAPRGNAGLELELALNLLDGEYRMTASLLGEDGRVLQTLERELRVASVDRRAGGGLVHAPHTLAVRATRCSPA